MVLKRSDDVRTVTETSPVRISQGGPVAHAQCTEQNVLQLLRDSRAGSGASSGPSVMVREGEKGEQGLCSAGCKPHPFTCLLGAARALLCSALLEHCCLLWAVLRRVRGNRREPRTQKETPEV